MIQILRKTAGVIVGAWDAAVYLRNGYRRIAELIGGSGTHTGKAITVEAAMRCSVPYVCTRAITECLSIMPLPVLRKVGDSTEILRKVPLFDVLNKRPNPGQTAKTFRRVLTHHALNYGNGFARIVRRGDKAEGEVIGLIPIHPRDFREKNIVKGEPEYVFSGSSKDVVLKNHECFHLMGFSDDGWTGIGTVELGKEAIAQLLSIEQYGATFFARGGMVAGMLIKPIPFTDDVSRKNFRKDVEAAYEGNQGFHKKLILEGQNWDYKSLGSNPTESQLVGARESMVPEICRFYGITPHLANDLSRAHFANVEHLWIEFLNVTEGPWMVAWEQEIERVLFTQKERDLGYYAKHNAAAFMRGDFEARMRGFAVLLQNGIASINECRSLEDWDPIPGGDAHHIQLNMQTVAGTGEPTASQAATLMKISDGKRKAS